MMAASLTVPAYAKVNLTLDILSVREDGYHGVATLMQTISQSDSVVLHIRDQFGVTLECRDARIPTGDENLAVRAAEHMMRAAGVRHGLHIELEKRIPAQAGLGGGSSDAAAVLRGLNHLLDLGKDSEELSALGAEIGSDVPFFCHGGTAACRGRGDIVTPLNDAPVLWFVVVKPELDVSTAAAYQALDAVPNRTSARATRDMEQVLESRDSERVIARMTNDFEQAMFANHVPLALLHDDFMMARSMNARLCGSGSAVFGVGMTRESAENIARMMRLKYENVMVCRSVTRAESVAFGEPVL